MLIFSTTIDLVKNVKRHTEESSTSKRKFQEKIEGSVKLHWQSIKLVHEEAKGNKTSTDLKSYRFKALISAPKHNVPTDAIKRLCVDFIDEYSGLTFADSSDVSLDANYLFGTLVLRIRQILNGDGCYNEFDVIFDDTPSFMMMQKIFCFVL